MQDSCSALLMLLVILSIISGCIGFQYPEDAPACVILKMDASLQVIQMGKNPKEVTSSLSDAEVDSGKCAEGNDTTAIITLKTKKQLPSVINFYFSKSSESIVIMDILVKFNPDNIFNNNDTDTKVTADHGNTRLSKDTLSYNCTSFRELQFPYENSTTFSYEFRMAVNNVAIQAFNVINGKLSPADECTTEETTMGPTSLKATTEQDITSQISLVTTEMNPSMMPSTAPGVPSPPAPGEPPVQSYTVGNKNGTCILLRCGTQFLITYNTTDKEETATIIGVPSINQVTFSGDCNQPNNTQNVEIKFYDDWNLNLKFSKFDDQGTEKYYLSEIDLKANLSRGLFPDIDRPVVKNIVQQFEGKAVSASVKGSYKCTEKVKFILTDQYAMETFNLHFAAFQKNITDFSDSDMTVCSNDVETNSNIPIAVGASLAGLIIIVLVAYLIGRRCEVRNSYDTIFNE